MIWCGIYINLFIILDQGALVTLLLLEVATADATACFAAADTAANADTAAAASAIAAATNAAATAATSVIVPLAMIEWSTTRTGNVKHTWPGFDSWRPHNSLLAGIYNSTGLCLLNNFYYKYITIS